MWFMQIRTLNRLLTWNESGIEWECDPRHVQILIREVLGSNTNISGKVTTPGVRDKPESLDEDDVHLEGGEAITRYRSLCMRMAYVAQD